MSLVDKGLARAARGHEKDLAKAIKSSMQPGESMVAWFHAMRPGESGQKFRAGMAAAAGPFLQQGHFGLSAVLAWGRTYSIDDKTPILRNWVVLTDRSILLVHDSLMGGKPKDVQSRIPFNRMAGLERLEQGYKVTVHFIHLGLARSPEDTLLVFEIPPYSADAFDDFREKLLAASSAS